MVTMAVTGFSAGANMGITAIIIIDVMGLDKLPVVYGTCLFMMALEYLTVGPLLGKVCSLSLL